MNTDQHDQLNIFSERRQVRVHYYDRGGALHTGILIRRIKKGRHKGACIVQDSNGRQFVPHKIRNIETILE